MEESPSNRSGIPRVEASFRPPHDASTGASEERGRAAFAAVHVEPLFDQLTALVQVVFGASAAVLSSAREGREYFRSAAGLPAPLAARRTVPLGESIARVCLTDGRLHAIDSGLSQHNAIAQAFGWAASLVAPVPGSALPLGSLWVVTDRDRAWSAADRTLLAAFASYAAEAAVVCEERDRAESDARDRHARFEALTGSLPHGLWCVAFDDGIATSLAGTDQVDRIFQRGRLVECNDVLARVLGAAFAEDLLGLPISDLIDAGDAGVRGAMLEFVRDNYRLDSLTTPIPGGKTGERRQLANLSGVVDSGRLTRLWGVVRAEPARAASPGRAGRSLDAIARLAGGVAHEFNNLLTTIRGHTELALRDRQDDDDLAEIRRATDRATALTRQLLAFSRKPVARPRVVDAAALVLELENVLHHVLGHGSQLAIRRSPGTGLLRADLAQLERALIQLVSFMCDGGPLDGALLIDIGDAKMSMGDGTEAAAVGIRVSHPGLVLDRETLSNIAASAFGDLTLHGGDGLVAAFALVRQNGGDILVESTAQTGTSFLILFPRLAQGSTIAEPGSPAESTASAETVLVVEDEDAVRAVARRTLLLQGYTVMEAENAQVALDLASAYAGRIDLLLTDVVMPGLNGPELSGKLRSARPETRVLFMSGYTGDAVPAGVLARDGFLEKPFTPMALARAVRQTLDRPDA
jgi:CheY-like chemotaxis protein/PAS domain-containing protein